MIKFFKVVLMILGVILLIIILLAAYLYFSNPTAVKTLITGQVDTSTAAVDEHPLLDSSQEAILGSLGVDVANLPTEMTEDLQNCLTEAVGADRALEIVNGSTPGVMDIIKAKHCLE